MAKPLGSTGEEMNGGSIQCFRALPMLGIGVAAFCVYLVAEQICSKASVPSNSSHHHEKQPSPSH